MSDICERGTETIVTCPDWLWEARAVPEKGICIDACIAEAVLAAWDRGVHTLGSCCGHGKENPNVVLCDSGERDVELARNAFAEIDPERTWTLYQWRLTDVSEARS